MAALATPINTWHTHHNETHKTIMNPVQYDIYKPYTIYTMINLINAGINDEYHHIISSIILIITILQALTTRRKLKEKRGRSKCFILGRPKKGGKRRKGKNLDKIHASAPMLSALVGRGMGLITLVLYDVRLPSSAYIIAHTSLITSIRILASC